MSVQVDGEVGQLVSNCQIMLYNVDLNSAQTRASMPVVSHLGTGIPHGGWPPPSGNRLL